MNTPELVPGETYRLIDQCFTAPTEDGLHSMKVQVQSCGASFVHFREIEAYGFVEDGMLKHVELQNGDVVTWFSWDRTREEKRRKLREMRDAQGN